MFEVFAMNGIEEKGLYEYLSVCVRRGNKSFHLIELCNKLSGNLHQLC